MPQRLDVLTGAVILCSVMVACGGGEQQPTEPDQPSADVASVEVQPDSATLDALDQRQDFRATARDPSGNAVSGVEFSWSVSPDSVASVDGTGRATATANGTAQVEATASGVTGSAELVVDQRTGQIAVTPESTTFSAAGESRDFDAETQDQNGHPVAGVEVEWSSTDPAVVTVDDTGRAVAQSAGGAALQASARRVRGYARITVQGAGDDRTHWLRISSGQGDGCAVTRDLRLYCWGENAHGQLGYLGEEQTNPVPQPIEGPVILDRVAVGGSQNCALAPDGTGYCWGNSTFGEGGYGSNTREETDPTEVSGNYTFADLTAGANHTCGVATDGTAYCWGHNIHGQLGDGSTEDRNTPVAVEADVAFKQITAPSGAQGAHSCAVSTAGTAYCWGNNRAGQLGDGTSEERSTPTPVETDRAFAEIRAGMRHTCARTEDGAVYCWGQNSSGQLGDGTTEDRTSPVRVQTDLVFEQIAVGATQSCGLTADGTPYCWGGQGNGIREYDTTPIPRPVSGGHSFRTIDAGSSSTCAIDTDAVAYCWGLNSEDALGTCDGTDKKVPTRIAEPSDSC